MFTYKFYSNESKGNSVRLRIRSNRSKTEISTGIKLSAADLEDALSMNPKPANLRWKSVLLSISSKIDDIRCDMLKAGRGDEDVQTIRRLIMSACFNEESPSSVRGKFVEHFESFIAGKQNQGTRGLYKHTLDRIMLFDSEIGGKNFEDIDINWLEAFEAFCAQTASKNARNIHLRNIRAIFNSAIDHDITTVYPFRRFKIRNEKTRKRSLSVEDLRDLWTYPVEEYAEIYRDMFKLIFLLIGINVADLYALQHIDRDGRIEYRRAKTGRLYSVKVEPEALEIIEKYRGAKSLLRLADRWGDHRNFLHQCNKALQRIGTMERRGLGGKKIIEPRFPEITTYWARHSWATIAYQIGVSKDVIAQALGHSDGHDVTNIYIDESNDKVDEANRRVIDYVLKGVEGIRNAHE